MSYVFTHTFQFQILSFVILKLIFIYSYGAFCQIILYFATLIRGGGVNSDVWDYLSWHLNNGALGINNHFKKKLMTYLEKKTHPTYLRFLA